MLLACLVLASAVVLPAATAAAAVPSAVEGDLWIDVDADGIRDTGEPDAPNVTVTLLSGATPVATTTTDAAGHYVFEGLAAGSYSVRTSAPLGYAVSPTTAENDFAPAPSVPPAPGGKTGTAGPFALDGTNEVPGTDGALRPLPELDVAPLNPAVIDGFAPFDEDGTCPTLTPGDDCGSSDGVVRTLDRVVYNWSVTADNYDQDQGAVDAVVFEQTITPDPSNPGALFTIAVPAACQAPPAGTGGANPPSEVIDNGDGSFTLRCNLGALTEGTAEQFSVSVEIEGGSPGGSRIISSHEVYGVDAEGLPNAVPDTSPEVETEISAGPRWNLTKNRSSYVVWPGLDTYDFGNGPEPAYILRFPITISTDRLRGAEALDLPATFVNDILGEAVGGGANPAFTLDRYALVRCDIAGTSGANQALSNQPYGVTSPSQPEGEPYSSTNSVVNSGSCAVSPSATVADEDMTLTVDGTDFSGPYPTETTDGVDLSNGPYFVASFTADFLLPISEIDRSNEDEADWDDPASWDGLGSVAVSDCLSEFDPDGLSGNSNFSAGFEPGWDGSTASGDNCLGPVTIQYTAPGTPPPFKMYQSYAAQNGVGAWVYGAGFHDGQGLVGVGSRVTAFSSYGEHGGFAGSRPGPDVVCDVFDNQVMRLIPNYAADALPGQYAWIASPPNPTVAQYHVEYAAAPGGGWGTEHLDGPLDTTQDRYPIDTGTQPAQTCDDDDAGAGGWVTDPTTLPGGVDSVAMVRAVPTDGTAPDFTRFDAVTTLIPLEVRQTFNGGPDDGDPIPAGTIVPNWTRVRLSGDWNTVGYFPWDANGNESAHGDGDRITIRDIQLGITKQTTTPASNVDQTALVLAGTDVVWRLNPSVTSLALGSTPAEAEDVEVVDVLPDGTTYDAACTAAQGGVQPSTVEPNTPNPGETRLTWLLGDLPAGVAVPPLYICTGTDGTAPNNTTLTNHSEISSSGASAAGDEDDHTLVLQQSGIVGVSKQVDSSLDVLDDDQQYTLRWRNFSDVLNVAAPTVIDVLSYVGDGPGSLSGRNPASEFTGQLELTGAPQVTFMDGSTPGGGDPSPDVATISYTSDPPAGIDPDPALNTSTWCLEADFGDAGCPTSFADVTAVRFVSNYELTSGFGPRSGHDVAYELQASANDPGDVYANRFWLGSDTLAAGQVLRSNTVLVQVEGFALGDLVFVDVDEDGTYDAGTDELAPDGVTVQLLDSGGTVIDTTTTTDGRYLFTRLPAGDYRVRIPSSEFQTGGLLEGYDVAPSAVADPDDDVDEDADHNAAEPGDLATTGITTGLVTLSSQPPATSTSVPTGDEPLGDNVADLDTDGTDDFSNLTLDLGLVASTEYRLEKVLEGQPTPLGNGQWEVSYLLTVGNDGARDGTYDLLDELRFGDGIEVESSGVQNLTPGSVSLNPGWDGLTDTTVATGVAIGGVEEHTYRVTAVVSFAESIPATPQSLDCTLGGAETDTGLLNEAVLVVDSGNLVDDACAELPLLEIDKQLVGAPAPVAGQPGQLDVTYEVTVRNTGPGGGEYDLTDELRFGAGVQVLDASVANTTPGSISTDPTWDGTSQTSVATGVAIGGGATHTYTVTVRVSADLTTLETDAADCDLAQGEAGTGLLNEADLSWNDIDDAADDCAPLGAVTFAKDLVSVTAVGDGRWEVAYDLEVANAGDADTTYDLDDELRFGAGVSVVSAQVANTAPGSITTDPAWDGATNVAVVDGQSIGQGQTHSYRVTVVVELDPAAPTPTDLDCELGQGETGTGLFNEATLTAGSGTIDDDACGELPLLQVEKQLVGDPVAVAGEPGQLDVSYDITVTNTGQAGGIYDLADRLRFGAGVSVVSAQVLNTAPGSITTDPAWDGAANLVVVDDVPLAAGGTHVYRVVARVAVDVTSIDPVEGDCSLDAGEQGTGLLNETALTWNDLEDEAEACAPVGSLSFSKDLVSAEPVGDGRWQVAYDIVVVNDGDGPATYDLDDRLRFGAGVSVVSAEVENTDPGSITTDPAWDGVGSTNVVSGEVLAGGETHTYRVVVVADVPLELEDAGADDCELGGEESGTGLLNEATLTSAGQELDDDACAPLPSIVLEKALTSQPVRNADGSWTAAYELVVQNDGSAAGTYDLEDELAFAGDVQVVSAEITGTDPPALAVNPTWNGVSDTTVASGVVLQAATTHRYTVAVTVRIPTGLTEQQRDCDLESGEGGSGLLNRASISVNDRDEQATACGPLSDTTTHRSSVSDDDQRSSSSDQPRLAYTGGDVLRLVLLGLALMLVGTVVHAVGRRRREGEQVPSS